jgi:RNA polymerase sigma-70 factor (ECF subfamily)
VGPLASESGVNEERRLRCLMGVDNESGHTDGSSFEQIAASVYPALVRRLTLMLRDHAAAEDVAQAALLKGYQAWSPGAIADPRAWIFTIAVRLALNENRRRRRWWSPDREVDGSVEMNTDPDLWIALGELSQHERICLVLNVLDGYSQTEIARRLGVPAGTVATWLYRGKAKLRERLSPEGM